jgi:hypothetical protein
LAEHDLFGKSVSTFPDHALKAAELFAGKNLGKAFPLTNPLGRADGRKEGKLTDGL